MAEEVVHTLKLNIGMLAKSQTPSFQVRMTEWMVDGRTYRMVRHSNRIFLCFKLLGSAICVQIE
jgi:hypothetical protein